VKDKSEGEGETFLFLNTSLNFFNDVWNVCDWLKDD